MIDLRSDSSSMPTDAMRRAMAEAEVGNDAFKEDPTVNELEMRSASLLNKEAALFVSSGTMGNLLALLTATCPGDGVIAGRQSHIVRFEAGAPARLGGLSLIPFDDPAGRMGIDSIESFLKLPMNLKPRILTHENTHNSSGGLVLTLDEQAQYGTLAREHGLHYHLDGARLFNAATALGVPSSDIAKTADTVTFCLSKCLSAPVGSILAGKTEFIKRARDTRFQLGGQMRQVGVLAAAGLVALDTMIPQIKIDHINAKLLAEGLAEIDGIEVSIDLVQTNIVLFDVSNLVTSAQEFEDILETKGVYASVFSPHQIRFITYRNINEAIIAKVIKITKEVAEELRSR